MYKLIISRDYLLLPFCQIIWTNILQDCIAASNNLSNLLNKRDCLKITGLKWNFTMFLQKLLHPIVNCAVGAPFAQMGDRWMEFVLEGHSTTTWTLFLPNFEPLPHSSGQLWTYLLDTYPLSRDETWNLYWPPPLLVHVVFEWPLIPDY